MGAPFFDVVIPFNILGQPISGAIQPGWQCDFATAKHLIQLRLGDIQGCAKIGRPDEKVFTRAFRQVCMRQVRPVEPRVRQVRIS